MKKDFTQPFIQSETTHMSVFIQTHDGRFALAKTVDSYPTTEEEYTPIRVELKSGQDVRLQLAKSLYKLGLSITRLRQLTSEDEVQFSFIDDTPGTFQTQVIYFAEADLVTQNNNLILTSVEDLEDYSANSSFFTELEQVGLSVLLSQI